MIIQHVDGKHFKEVELLTVKDFAVSAALLIYKVVFK